jgi:hypothetical protein
VTAWQHFYDIELLEVELTGTADAAGVVLVESEQVEANKYWRIERYVISCDSATDTTFRLYKGRLIDKDLRAASYNGNLDVAEGSSPLRVPSGRAVIGQWTGATPGSTATLVLEGMLVQRVQVGVNEPY